VSYGYRLLPIEPPVRLHSVATAVPVCEQGRVFAVLHVPSLPQCTYFESGGERCELEHEHGGGHAFPDAVFLFLQRRYGNLHGPICRRRRGPAEYVYEEEPMCL